MSALVLGLQRRLLSKPPLQQPPPKAPAQLQAQAPRLKTRLVTWAQAWLLRVQGQALRLSVLHGMPRKAVLHPPPHLVLRQLPSRLLRRKPPLLELKPEARDSFLPVFVITFIVFLGATSSRQDPAQHHAEAAAGAADGMMVLNMTPMKNLDVVEARVRSVGYAERFPNEVPPRRPRSRLTRIPKRNLSGIQSKNP